MNSLTNGRSRRDRPAAPISSITAPGVSSTSSTAPSELPASSTTRRPMSECRNHSSSARAASASSRGTRRYEPTCCSACVRSSIRSSVRSQRPWCGRELSTVTASRVPPPAAVRLRSSRVPGSNRSSFSVRGYTATSPRIPCGLTMRPTARCSGPATLLSRGFPSRLRRRLLATGSHLDRAVTAELLPDPRLREQRAGAVGRHRPFGQPLQGLLAIDVDRHRLLARVVGSDRVEEAAVARAPRIGHHHPVEGLFLGAHAPQSDAYAHVFLPPEEFGSERSLELLHHLVHLRELLEELIHFLDGGAAAARDPLAPAAVEDLRIAPLRGGHGQNDRLGPLHPIRIDLRALELLAHARDHAQEPLQRSHLLELPHGG